MTIENKINIANNQYVDTVCLVDASGNPYTASGGSGGSGSSLSDTLLTDDSATQFLARDSGSAITYVTLAGATYTPTTNIRSVVVAGGSTSALQTSGNTLITATNTAVAATNTALGTVNTTLTAISTKTPALGANTKANSQPVTIASDQGNIAVAVASIVAPTGPTTGTLTTVTSAATNTTILASNAARKGAMIYNASTAILYLLMATGTSSATVYSLQIAAGGTISIRPGEYSGVITGTWATANGSAQVTEFV